MVDQTILYGFERSGQLGHLKSTTWITIKLVALKGSKTYRLL